MKNSYRLRQVFPVLMTALGLSTGATAQVTLQNNSYVQTFDNIGTGLPEGFSVRTGATATAPGTEVASFSTNATAWGSTNGRFGNYASADGLKSNASLDVQSAYADRALGVRQTGSFGDPGAAFVFQAANTTGKTDFKLNFKLQSLDSASTRTTTWRVEYATGDSPTSFQSVGSGTTGGSTFRNTTISVDFGNRLNNVSEKVWIRIVALANSAGTSNRPTTAIDDFTLSWQAPAATDPSLTVPSAPLTFESRPLNTTSPSQSYQLSAANLTGDVTVTAPAGFTVSKDDATFASTLTFTPTELAAAKTVYVRFTPTASGVVSGTISHTTAGTSPQTVTVSGTGFDPNDRVFSFDNCATTLSDGWAQFSVLGTQTWGCTTFGRDATDATGKANKAYGVQINGFADGSNVLNEDWLISPALNTASFTYPLLSFYSRVAFNGAPLQVKVSTNYTGTGSPTAAGVTWTDVAVDFPVAGSDVWTLTDNVDLSAFKSENLYVAFVYSSTTDEGARWTLDDIRLRNSSTQAPPSLSATPTSVAFGYRTENTTSTQPLNVALRNLTAGATITSSNPVFQVSKDGTTFANSVSFEASEASITPKNLTVRFRPTQANNAYTGTLTVTSAGATTINIDVTGNTYNVANTLEVVNWNVEWFGSTEAGFGPDDKTLQQENVKKVLTALNADVFALAEVVDTVRLGTIVRQLGGYKYMVSTTASNVRDASDLAKAQKLAFVYRPSVVKNPTFTSLLACPDQGTSCDAYNYWASGRYPYAMTADVTLGSTTKRVTFVLVHAKANTSPTATSYERRKNGAIALKAKLDTDYATDNFIILGDFNDDLDQTITAGITPAVSSYQAFVDDVTNYQALTLPLSLAKKKSTASYDDIIDHVVVSNEMAANYLANSAEIETGVAASIANYAKTTSDHYPVQTRYTFSTITSTKQQVRRAEQLVISPNPAREVLTVQLPVQTGEFSLQVTAADGRVVFTGTGRAEQLNQQLNQRFGGLKAGLYVVRATSAQNTYIGRFVKQ
ncbi:T9SS C-terminal target domain-containing protein [Hymenobacter sediminis]|uniref:T9SS-dependent choice-of-anchor J family protein n=1 Tax=Hymenobacter sediminis TaxID=2218621 RepID=UPI000DA6B8F7|nr:choice-of-anchor J domain-containing protein [Hymenobacter sediminis]RPD47809.1 T9SS C-terminal target domain-containing protein [Hymenobacter sediminis]